MSFSPVGLAAAVDTIGEVLRAFFYRTTDSISIVTGAGYFVDIVSYGGKVGDLFVILNGSDDTVCGLTGIDADGDGTITPLEGGASSSIVSFATFASAVSAAAAGEIASDTIVIEVLTYSGNDDGRALYRRVSVEPTHSGKIENADGDWWEYILEDGFVRVSAFGIGIDALNLAWTVSKRVILTEGDTYEVDTGETLTSDGEDVEIVGPNSTIRVTGASSAFKLRGGWSDIQTPTVVTADVWTVPSTSGYARGDVLKVAQPGTPLWHYILGSGTQGEFVVVEDVDATTVTFAFPTLYTYTAGYSPTIGKLKDNVCRVDIGTLEYAPDVPATTDASMVFIEAFRRPDVRIRSAPLVWENVVVFVSGYGGTAVVDDCEAVIYIGEASYCVSLNSSEYMHVQVKNARGVWTLVDGIAQGIVGRGTELSQYGHTAFNIIHDCVSHGSARLPYSWHGGTWNNRYINCQSSQGFGTGFSVRGMFNEGINCRSIRDESGVAAFRQSGFAPVSGDTGAIGVYADRGAHDAELAKYVYISTDGAAGVGAPVAYYKTSNTSAAWSAALPYTGPLDDFYATGERTHGTRWDGLEVIEPQSEFITSAGGAGDMYVNNFYFKASEDPPASPFTRDIRYDDGSLYLSNGRIDQERVMSLRSITITNMPTLSISNVVANYSGTLSGWRYISDNGSPETTLIVDNFKLLTSSTVLALWHSELGAAIMVDTDSRLSNIYADHLSAWIEDFTDADIGAIVKGPVFRGSVGLYPTGMQTMPRSTTAALADVTATVNTLGKYSGKVVINTTSGAIVTANGATAASLWLALDGTTAHTPV